MIKSWNVIHTSGILGTLVTKCSTEQIALNTLALFTVGYTFIEHEF